MVIWICGLSGAGKTTIGQALYQRWKPHANHTVLVDGDEMRRLLALDRSPADYSATSRIQVSERLADMAAWLDRQAIHVIVCNISIAPELLERNRQRFNHYFEVFVDVPLDVLAERDTKGIYTEAYAGQREHVVGVDIAYARPRQPDLVINNADFATPPRVWAEHILDRAGLLEAINPAAPQ